MFLIGGLLKIDLLREQLLLSQLVCSGSLAVVLGASERSLGLPVGSRRKRNLGRLSVNTDRLIVYVATSKDAGLQVLVLAILAVEAVSPQWRAAVIDSAHIGVLPVNTLSHQGAVVLRVFVGAECISGRPVELLVHLPLGWDMSLGLKSSARGPLDLFISRAGHVLDVVSSKESLSALGLSTELFSVELVGLSTPKHSASERVLLASFAQTSRTLRWLVEDVTLERVGVTRGQGLVGRGLRLLDSLVGSTLVEQWVRVLVGGTGHSGAHWLVVEDVLVGARLNDLGAGRLLVECLRAEGVGVAVSLLRAVGGRDIVR